MKQSLALSREQAVLEEQEHRRRLAAQRLDWQRLIQRMVPAGRSMWERERKALDGALRRFSVRWGLDNRPPVQHNTGEA